jgi:hypothetical protein
MVKQAVLEPWLWFDVISKGYSTCNQRQRIPGGCGLM